MRFGQTMPILRIFDEPKAKEFYVDFLSFKIDWEHRMSQNSFRCPACGFQIFNRRVAKCEACGNQLPNELLFTPDDVAKLDAQYEKNRILRREQMRKARSDDLGGGGFGGADFGGDGGACD